MTLLTSCCGCFSLKSGTIITIVILFVLSLFHLALVMSMVGDKSFSDFEVQEKAAVAMPIIIAVTALIAFFGIILEKGNWLIPILVMCVLLILNSLISMRISGDDDATPLPVFLMMLATVFISILPPIYLWMVMFSYYQKLKEEEDRERRKEDYCRMEAYRMMQEPLDDEEIEDLMRKNCMREIEFYQYQPE